MASITTSVINVGWVRHAVCAVTHQQCRQALIKKGAVLLRNVWWVTQKPLTHPTLCCSFQEVRRHGIHHHQRHQCRVG